MSNRIYDDQQRIDDLQEIELRNRKDQSNRLNQEKIKVSFSEVIKQKEMRQKGLEGQQGLTAKRKAQTPETDTDPVLQAHAKRPRDNQALARMSRSALQEGLTKSASKTREDATQMALARRGDLQRSDEEDKNRVNKQTREQDRSDDLRQDDAYADLKQQSSEAQAKAELQTDPNGGKHQNSGDGDQQSSQGDQRRPEATVAAASPLLSSGTFVAKIPPKVMSGIVDAIYAFKSADGRTEMQVDLKGHPMLEGVQVKVKSMAGKVSCTIDGGSPELKNLLRSHKNELKQRLAEKGLLLNEMNIT